MRVHIKIWKINLSESSKKKKKKKTNGNWLDISTAGRKTNAYG